MKLYYNKETEVTQKQYAACENNFKGILAFREEAGKFFIKLWLMSYSNDVKYILKNN